MKVDLKKKRALAAAVLLSLGCYGQAWAEDSIITISADGKNLKMDARDTATYDPTIAGNSRHLKEHDGVYEFVNDNGKSFDSIEWSGTSDASGMFGVKRFLDGNLNYTVLTKNLNIDYKRTNVQPSSSLDYYAINTAKDKTVNLGLKTNTIENLEITGGISSSGSVNIFTNKLEGTDFSIDARPNLENGIVNINAKKIHIKGDYLYYHGAVNINQDQDYSKSTVQIDGDISVGLDHDTAKNQFKVNFYGKDSYLNGTVYNPAFRGTGAYLIFDEGAQWNFPSDDDYSILRSLKLLNSSEINFNSKNSSDKFKHLVVSEDFDGTGGIIKMAFDGSKKINVADWNDPDYGYHGDYIEIN